MSSELRELPEFQVRDPFDRLLLAQAKAMGMRLLTVDAKVLQYLMIQFADSGQRPINGRPSPSIFRCSVARKWLRGDNA